MAEITYHLEVFDGPLDLLLHLISKNKLNIYYKDSLYQIKGEKRFNALKYVNIFYKYFKKLLANINNYTYLCR